MAWGDNTKSPWDTNNKGSNKGRPTANNDGKTGGQSKISDIEELLLKSRKNNSGGNRGNSNGGDFFPFQVNGLVLSGLFAVVLIGWLLTGFYEVDSSEEGVVLRFGKYHRTEIEGLGYHLPSPIEKVYITQKTKVNSIQIGYRSEDLSNNGTIFSRNDKQQQSFGRELRNSSESLMITGDTNIADVTFVVQWRIANSLKYLFNITNPEQTIRYVAESAMREVIGRSKFAEAMTTNRNIIANEVYDIIQSVLDSYDAGIEIYAVNLNDVQNPSPVMPAFLDVETAKQDKETAINRAKSYENDIIPKARGDAEKMIKEAEAYREQVVSLAKGQADRFSQVLKEYNKAKDVTKRRIYLETMQEIFADTDKILVGSGVGENIMPYLPLNELNKKNK